MSARDELFARFARHYSAGKAELYKSFGFDLVLGRREGATMVDALDPDRRFLNCHCNGGVFNLGHRHPAILAAVEEALGEVDIGNHHLISPRRVELGEALSATTGDRLSKVILATGGGEAIDTAIKAARAATGRAGVVSAIGGYHGHTGLAMATGDAAYREPFGDIPAGFSQVPFGDLGALANALGGDTAAVILEPIPATLGMALPPEGYLEGVQSLCRERGAAFILDEVQTGLGRTGTVWYHQQHDLDPDILVTAKGLSGGIYPIAATLLKPEYFAIFDREPFIHISTFGGAEPGCAAALAVLDIVTRPEFLGRVRALGERFEARLGQRKSFQLRRRGLFMGLAFEAERGGQFAAKMLFDRGVFATWANNDKKVLQFLPPLLIAESDVDELCDRIESIFP